MELGIKEASEKIKLRGKGELFIRLAIDIKDNGYKIRHMVKENSYI